MSIFICIITIFVLPPYNKSSVNLSEATPRIVRFDTRKVMKNGRDAAYKMSGVTLVSCYVNIKIMCTGFWCLNLGLNFNCLTLLQTCNFDDSSICGFSQDGNDNFDWARLNVKTWSDNTGPNADHTVGDYSGKLRQDLWLYEPMG